MNLNKYIKVLNPTSLFVNSLLFFNFHYHYTIVGIIGCYILNLYHWYHKNGYKKQDEIWSIINELLDTSFFSSVLYCCVI